MDSVALFDPHASGWFLSGGLKNLDSDAEMLSLSGTGDADKILRLNLITVCQSAWDENDRTVINNSRVL